MELRIKTLTVQNIGVFRRLYISFPAERQHENAEIHLFTGSNGSGKSTILQALAAGFNATTTQNGVCMSVANHLVKKLKSTQHTNGQYDSHAKVTLSNNAVLTSRGCSNCGNLHIDSQNEQINNYRSQVNLLELPAYSFHFAVLCYSGYRSISYRKDSVIANERINPLLHALEFNKPIESNYTIQNLLTTALLKRAYAQQQTDDKVAAHYDAIIKSIEKSISNIIGKPLEFVLSLQPVINVLFKTDEGSFDFDVLADGLKSLISWIADLVLRLDMLKWKDDTPVFERNVILLLDEIEVHLHPSWQRKVLPIVQKLLPNAQIFATTHSPFVVNSVNDAYLYRLSDIKEGRLEPISTSTQRSYINELIETFSINEEFGEETQKSLDKFMGMKKDIIFNRDVDIQAFKTLTRTLTQDQNSPIYDIVQLELNKLVRTAPAKREYVYD
jgi:predicted ATP-binding protein involved in virulence